jgi:hypothetical protein
MRQVRAGLLMLAFLVGCSDKSPTGASQNANAGVWLGTLTDASNGAGTLRVELEGRGASVVGTWVARFARGGLCGPARAPRERGSGPVFF